LRGHGYLGSSGVVLGLSAADGGLCGENGGNLPEKGGAIKGCKPKKRPDPVYIGSADLAESRDFS